MLALGYETWIDIRLPWEMDTALSVFPIVLVGFMLGEKYSDYCRQKNKYDILFLVLFVVLAAVVAVLHPGMDLRTSQYPSPYLTYYLYAFAGIGLITVVGKYANSRLLGYLGRNSLIIMCVHEPVKRIAIQLVHVLSGLDVETIRVNIVLTGIVSFITILSVVPMIGIINRYFPFMLGRIKKRG